MAAQNHKSQPSRAEPTGALRSAGLGVHRQIQQMILSCHDSVIHCCLDRSQPRSSAGRHHQQQPDEHHQQHRVPLRPAPSSTRAPAPAAGARTFLSAPVAWARPSEQECPRSSHASALAEPAAIPSPGPPGLGANTAAPPGVSSADGILRESSGHGAPSLPGCRRGPARRISHSINEHW